MKILYILLAGIILSCGNMTDMNSSDEKQYPDKIKFHTKESPGVWDSYKESHTPIVSRDPQNSNKIIVRVPFNGKNNPKHYIEVIVLKQGSKELKKKVFSFSYNEAVAEFTLPDPEAKDYTVVAKCNTHGMWISPVPGK